MASLHIKPSDAELAALDEALADFDLSDTAPTDARAPAAPSALVSVINDSVALAVNTPRSKELEAFYRPMDKTQAETLRAVAAKIKERDRIARFGIIETGKDLIAIKNSIPGQFDRWLKVEFDMSKATAWNYINAAQQFGGAPKVVEILPPATVYRLAAKATPAELRKTVVAEIESGALPSKDEVEHRIAAARNLAADEQRALKKAAHRRAVAQRQKLEDEKAWQLRAKELIDAGKTEAEVKEARQIWDNKNEAKLREKLKREAAKKNEANKQAADREGERQNAKRIANWLLSALGPEKFEIFRSKLLKSNQWDVMSYVKDMDSASVGNTHVENTDDKTATEITASGAGTVSAGFGSF